MEGYELELSEVDLRSISKELSGCKGKVQSLTRSYLVSDDPSLAADAHKLLSEVDEFTNRVQKRIQQRPWSLGMLLEG